MSVKSPVPPAALATLEAMGFPRKQCEEAYKAAGGDLSLATELLLGGGDSGVKHHHAPAASLGSPDIPGWTCPQCTYHNEPEAKRCDMCLESKPGSVPAPHKKATGMAPFPTPAPVTVPAPVPAKAPVPAPSKKKPHKVTNFSPPSKRRRMADQQKEKGGGPVSAKVPDQPLDDDAPANLRPALQKLSAYFLSPASSTEGDFAPVVAVNQMDDREITKLIRQSVPDVDDILDRTQTQPIIQLILATYHSGLPVFASQPAIKAHTSNALKYIFSSCATLTEPARKRHMVRLSDAFTSCQAEQARVIDSIYGEISGRDKGLREQILSLVDDQKQRVLDQVSNILNPDAWHTGDDNPIQQLPHIQSSYKIAVGKQLGLRGIASAQADKNQFQVAGDVVKKIDNLFHRLFSVRELAHTILEDINQQKPDADRVISLDTFTKWAGDNTRNNGFEMHSIFYDEDNPKEYDEDAKPLPENVYRPFLSVKVAVDVLQRLFLPPPYIKL